MQILDPHPSAALGDTTNGYFLLCFYLHEGPFPRRPLSHLPEPGQVRDFRFRLRRFDKLMAIITVVVVVVIVHACGL